MQDVEFWKMSGSGNDFILIDNRKGEVPEAGMNRLVERICRRRESVGADGVIFIVPSDTNDFKWRFLNADGGEAEMCGNGARCAARFAHLNGIAGQEMTFDTIAGPISAHVNGRIVKVRMPRPFGLKSNIALNSSAGLLNADFINTGVPHIVVQVDELETFPVFEVGRWIRNHDEFAPEGANANFIRITGPDSLEIRTYERGVEDETLACGTGAMAAALSSSTRGLVGSPTKIKTRGGEELIIHYKEVSGRFDDVWLEGSTSIIYTARLGGEAV
jgi:diaminopimelate epimerase